MKKTLEKPSGSFDNIVAINVDLSLHSFAEVSYESATKVSLTRSH